MECVSNTAPRPASGRRSHRAECHVWSRACGSSGSSEEDDISALRRRGGKNSRSASGKRLCTAALRHETLLHVSAFVPVRLSVGVRSGRAQRERPVRLPLPAMRPDRWAGCAEFRACAADPACASRPSLAVVPVSACASTCDPLRIRNRRSRDVPLNHRCNRAFAGRRGCRGAADGVAASPVSASAVDVALELLDGVLLLLDDGFHQVADRHYTDHSAVLDDRQMPDAAFGDEPHAVLDRVFRRYGDDG